MSALGAFCDWLSRTPISEFIQITSWVVPATQTIHILALAMVFFLMTNFDLQVMGLIARPTEPNWTRRPLPWLWWGLTVLLASGLILIVGEPRRELFSWPLRIKLVLVVVATLLTVVLSRMAARSPPPPVARLIAALTLLCWVVIVVAGRWIAYINFGEEEGL